MVWLKIKARSKYCLPWRELLPTARCGLFCSLAHSWWVVVAHGYYINQLASLYRINAVWSVRPTACSHSVSLCLRW